MTDSLAAAVTSLVDDSSGQVLSGDIYIGLFDRRGNTPVADFSLEWNGFTDSMAESTLIVVVTTTDTSTDGSGGSSAGDSGGFGGNAGDNFDGEATTTVESDTDTEPLVGSLYLMKNADDKIEEVGMIREFYNMPVSGVLADPLSYPLGGTGQKISDVVRNGKLARYFFEWRRGEEVATTSTFAIVPESITPKLYSGEWLKEGQSTASVWWFFGRVPTEAGLSGTLRLMKITDRTKQEVEEVTTFGPQPISNRSKVWDNFPDVVDELTTGEYFFELEHLSGKISSRPFKIADQNIELPSQTLAVNGVYEIAWKSASGPVTGELWLLGQSGNGQKVVDINPQDKKYTWTAPSSPRKNVYFEIRTTERHYVSPTFSVTEAPVAIVPDCSLLDPWFLENSINPSPNQSVSLTTQQIYLERAQSSPLNLDEINFCTRLAGVLSVVPDPSPNDREWYFEKVKLPQTPRRTPEENRDFVAHRDIMTACVDFGDDIRKKYQTNNFSGATGEFSNNPPTDTFAEFDRGFLVSLGDSFRDMMSYEENMRLGTDIESYSQINKLNAFLWATGYLRLPTLPKTVSQDFALGGYGKGSGNFQTQINQSTNEAIKAFKIANNLPLVNQAGKSELDYITRQKIAELTGCKKETSFILLDPLSTVPTDFLTAMKSRLAKSWATTKTKLPAMNQISPSNSFSLPIRNNFIPGNSLEAYLRAGGEDAYPTPVNYCTGVVGPGTQGYLSPTVFPYDFKRTNVCPYFSAGFDYTAQLSQDDFAYNDGEMKYDNLTNLLWTLSCVPRGVTDVKVVSNGVKAFQSANGLPVTGIIDQATGKILDRMWAIPGLNTINTPNTYLPFVLEFDDEISGPPSRIEMVKNLPGFLQVPNATGVSWGTRLFSPVIDFVPDTEQYYCPSTGQSPKHSLTITNNISERKFLGGNFVVYKKIKSATGSDYHGGGAPVLDLTWSSNNLSDKQKLAVFIDDMDNQATVLIDPDFSITNKGFYPLPLSSLPAGKYSLRLETVVNSYYDISNQGIAGFVSAMAPDFWQTEFPAEPADLKNHSTFNLLTRIIGALPPPPTYSVQAIGPTFEIRDETAMTDEEYADYLKEEVSAGIRRDIVPALQVPLR